jgi:hypothetical protein
VAAGLGVGLFLGLGGGVFAEELGEEGLALGVGEGGVGGGGGLLLLEEFVEDVAEVEGVGAGAGVGDAMGVDELDERSGGAEADGVQVAGGEQTADGVDGFGGGSAELAGDIVPEVVLTAIELGDEEGVAILPAKEGGAVNAEAGADVVVFGAGEDVIEDELLLVGEGSGNGSCECVVVYDRRVKMGERIFASGGNVASGCIWLHWRNGGGSGGVGWRSVNLVGGFNGADEIFGHWNLPLKVGSQFTAIPN